MCKKLIIVFLLTVTVNAYATVSVYESFADAQADVTLAGYSGTTAEIGLTGTWAVPQGGGASNETTESRSTPEYVGVSGGHTPSTAGGNQHWWEHMNNWTICRAERSLSTPIDMTVDGTYYMSFFTMAGNNDYTAQMGLSDGTDELMWGNGYGGGSKGLAAYYGIIGTDSTGTDGVNITQTNWETGFFVAKIVKSDSGVSDTVTVSMKFYNLGKLSSPTNTIDSSDPAAWDLTKTLTGVSTTFDTLQLKLNGGGNWPSMDEIRIGASWLDVTGVPEPATMVLLGIGSILALRRRK